MDGVTLDSELTDIVEKSPSACEVAAREPTSRAIAGLEHFLADSGAQAGIGHGLQTHIGAKASGASSDRLACQHDER